MVSRQRIQDYADRVAAMFHPERIILFGSYAYGMPNEDSDVDLLVVMPSKGRDRKKSVEIQLAVRESFPLDLLVYDPAYLQQRADMEDWFVREILGKGQTLYENRDEGVGAKSGRRLEQSRARKNPNDDAACFHAQQCAEKYLKAILIEAGIIFPKTHALPALLALVLPIKPSWDTLLPAVTDLSSYGVDYRYPGANASRDDAKEARKNCATVRAAIRVALDLAL